ncbi:MAG TPA: ABC transporter permease [Acidimicrobiia bacterium]|nr:ABC transporter permease [Acidimicrobiia bacterium]
MTLAQTRDEFFRWDWVVDNAGAIWDRVVEHVYLTSIALAVGLIVSLALSVVALRYRRTYAPITWATGLLYTIPSLALFAFFVPITGFTTLTAEIGLVSYTLLILIRNIVAGIDGVDPFIKEAALGMGYTRRRLFLEIEVPLALPVIVAGLRIAAVTTIGLVTVTALVGQGGLGFFILRGLNRFFDTEIIVGTVLSVALAVAVDLTLLLIERSLTPWARRRATV